MLFGAFFKENIGITMLFREGGNPLYTEKYGFTIRLFRMLLVNIK